MAKVIIFGTQDYAELAHYYLTNDTEHSVVAFTVNEKYMPKNNFFKDLPIVKFETISELYPKEDYVFFAPMAPNKMNTLREEIYRKIKALGYEMISYISSKATILNGGQIGDNCFVLEDNTIQPFTKIGNNVVLWSGNHIGHHGEIKDHVTVTSHVVISGHCIISENCFLGVNATLRDGITLAQGTLIAMSASVTKNTEAWGVYVGNPAKKIEEKNSIKIL